MKDKPLVSVVMSSYNHALYVKEAIYSVLSQTYNNFEFIINDDGSSDDTVKEIKKINDDRIQLSVFDENQGACASINRCIEQAKGKYIALINSDDVWVLDKLKKQVDFLEDNLEYDAVFSYAKFKNEKMEDFSPEDQPYFYNIFSQKNRTQAEWISKFFYEGNCICHPSILIKKNCYNNIGLYNNRLRQLPDFDMWIRFVKSYKLYIMPEYLINFRLIGNKNASSPTLVNQIRGRNESNLIFEEFFNGLSIELFKEAFKNKLIDKDFFSTESYECEKVYLYLNYEDSHYKYIGLKKLYHLMKDAKYREKLKENYDFDDKKFMNLSSEISYYLSKTIEAQNMTTSEMVKHIIYKIKKTPKRHILIWIYKYVKGKLLV